MGCGCGKKKKKTEKPPAVAKQEKVVEVKKKEKKLPSLPKRVQNLSKAVYNHITTGSCKVDDKVYLQRMRKCLTCEHLVKEKKACSICGCFVHTKTKWAEQECPDDPPRWKAIE